MALVLFAARDATLLWQLGAAALAVVVYALVLLALKTFSSRGSASRTRGTGLFFPFCGLLGEET